MPTIKQFEGCKCAIEGRWKGLLARHIRLLEARVRANNVAVWQEPIRRWLDIMRCIQDGEDIPEENTEYFRMGNSALVLSERDGGANPRQ